MRMTKMIKEIKELIENRRQSQDIEIEKLDAKVKTQMKNHQSCQHINNKQSEKEIKKQFHFTITSKKNKILRN